ncbi:ATP-binding protein [Plantibacter sp. Mn2098]|uniref:sensor histidine kinase n=1 Tax=Plantibacter sp. Mn2098 TaxID=3395266 RepID=UPI003BDEB6B7
MVDVDAPKRPRLRFATQVLLLQLLVVTAVIAISSAISIWAGVQRLAHEAQSTALSIAQSVAEDVDVRAEVTAESQNDGEPDGAALVAGPLPAIATAVERRTGAFFVVITDDRGIRLAHPDPAEIGKRVSTSPDAALRGEETVSWETGTLGPSARAKVPVYAAGSTGNLPADVVGEISVGFAPQRVFEDVVRDVVPVVVGVVAALAIGLLASVLIRRRLSRLTLGLQPEELAALVQNQAAVLSGVGEGVLAVSPTGVVTVCNDQAAGLFDVGDCVGLDFDDLGLPTALRELVAGREDTAEPLQLVVGQRVLFVDVRTVSHDGVPLGRVLVARDRTDVEALTRRLDAVAAMTTALRAQRHEFANRLHTIAGLLEIGQDAEARSYLANVLDHGPLKYPVEHADRLTEPYLQAFIGAKGVEAAERGVLLTLGSETLVTGSLCDPEDVTTVLGNLIDNAITAAVDGRTKPAWVEVEVLDHGSELHLSVMDSGDGVDDGTGHGAAGREPGAGSGAGGRGGADADAETDTGRIRGLGLGLPLSREIARRRGGDVWLASPKSGVDEPRAHGAVFCARLPGVIEPLGPEDER